MTRIIIAILIGLLTLSPASFTLAGEGRRAFQADIEIPLTNNLRPSIDRMSVGEGAFARVGTATYFDGDGVLQTAAENVPRTHPTEGLTLEPAGTNILLWCRDFTDVAWDKTNITAAKTQTGIDGVITSASSLTASANDGTCLQTLVSLIDDHDFAVYVKRLTGTGDVFITDDNGGNYTDITASLSTTAWYRADITRSQANPIVGFKIATDTDAIAVDFAQVEKGKKFPSMPKYTEGSETAQLTESGNPYWTLPADLFAETLDSEIATGTLTLGNDYKITADTGDDFYTGSAVGEYFTSDGTETCDADSKVQEVTNSWNNLPPHGTVVLDIEYGYTYTDNPAVYNALITIDETDSANIISDRGNYGRTYIWDMSDYGYVSIHYASGDKARIASKFGYLDSNISKMAIGSDHTTGSFVWGTETDYSGSFTIGTYLALAYNIQGPYKIKNIRIYKRILSDAEINHLGE